jgi:hypothetical protein
MRFIFFSQRLRHISKPADRRLIFRSQPPPAFSDAAATEPDYRAAFRQRRHCRQSQLAISQPDDLAISLRQIDYITSFVLR